MFQFGFNKESFVLIGDATLNRVLTSCGKNIRLHSNFQAEVLAEMVRIKMGAQQHLPEYCLYEFSPASSFH